MKVSLLKISRNKLVVNRLELSEIADLIRKELAYEGVSVIIPRRECIQTASRHAREKAKAKEGAK